MNTTTSRVTGNVRHRRVLGAALALSTLLSAAAWGDDLVANPTNPSGQLYASPAQVQLVQEKLRDGGHTLRVDGDWGRDTSAEVRDYQKAHDLPRTGQLDTSLLSALQIGKVLEGETSSTFLDGLLRTERAAVKAEGRGAPLYVSPMHVAQIQHVLREQGLYAGRLDGAWGPQTARAANKFRSSHGLEATDGLDIALLRALNQEGSVVVPKDIAAATARTDGVPLQAGPEAIRALQRELGQHGHEAVAVDGVWGETTRQALRDFQRKHELETTGTLTLPTLAALGIDITSKQTRTSQR